MLKFSLAVVLVFATLAPAMAQEDPHAIVANADAEYDRVFVTHDAEHLTTLYTDDATILPPTAPAISGSKAILGFWQTVLKGNWTTHVFQVGSAVPLSDNTILATTHWSADLADANGKVTPYRGDCVQVFAKINQGWKLRLVSWNVLK
jgi:ketosteroid isomerase-like protein